MNEKATPAPEPQDKTAEANIKQANSLTDLVHAGYKRAREIKEQSKRIEAHARDLEGSIISAGSVNQTDPARAKNILADAKVRYLAAIKKETATPAA